jgi:predicted dienelactone hydrolase
MLMQLRVRRALPASVLSSAFSPAVGHSAARERMRQRLTPPALCGCIAALIAMLAMGCGADEETVPTPDAGTDTSADAATDVVEDATDGSSQGDTGSDVVEAPEWISWDVAEAGPYTIGHRVFEHTYVAYEGDEPRTIRVHVWYPSTDTSGLQSDYLAGAFLDEFAWENAALAPPVVDGRYPVHVYSHGHRGFAGTSSFLMRHFASHGWVAVAPDHTNNLLTLNQEPRPRDLYWHRHSDVSESLNVLENLPTDDPLAGLVDTSRVIMSGHSYGVHSVWGSIGATYNMDGVRQMCSENEGCSDSLMAAFEAGARDERIVAAMPLAGAINRELFGPDGHASVTIPVLAMSGTDDQVGADLQFAETEGVSMLWIDLAGGCHQTFALGYCDTLDPALGFTIVNAWSLAFARLHVLNDTSAPVVGLLDNSISPWSEVAFQQHD